MGRERACPRRHDEDIGVGSRFAEPQLETETCAGVDGEAANPVA